METNLDNIIDRHATSSPFRPFTAQDWQAFSGCESKAPEIAEGGALGVVLDDNVVDVWAWHSDDHLVHVAKDAAAARALGTAIARADTWTKARQLVTAAKLADRGFEPLDPADPDEVPVFKLKVSAMHYILAAREDSAAPLELSGLVLSVFADGDDEVCAEWSVGDEAGLDEGVATLRDTIGEVEDVE